MEETPLDVTRKYVDGIVWPCSKEEALEALARNGAPDDVIETLRASDDQRFVSPADLHSSLWLES
ncbi:MAG: hypothetical protein AVDCRST_MAG53-2919 [uncultured Solirubrobacteraceae bacterium]|uniref:DUF2795 domain-containing protein n=1 Tax=uncultured Solirubrobacteraceae bacterium TaxID=1162706 RepID=A0A6J4T4X7_9ACTN|nr:MAG: hypothetical protein AVDCRST_MAG53-2919 [uncultured Solirubrobacteraceae bacterium]